MVQVEGSNWGRSCHEIQSIGFRVFDESTADLQYAIEDELRDLKQRAMLEEGWEPIDECRERISGPNGTLQKERQELQRQDALDARLSEHDFDDYVSG